MTESTVTPTKLDPKRLCGICGKAWEDHTPRYVVVPATGELTYFCFPPDPNPYKHLETFTEWGS